MIQSLVDFLWDNRGFVLLLVAVAILGAFALSTRAANPPEPPALPKAETKYVVTVVCNGGFLNTRTEFFFTNHPDGKGPALQTASLLTAAVTSFDAGSCMSTTVGKGRIWSSQGPFEGDVYFAKQAEIDKFLADEAAFGK